MIEFTELAEKQHQKDFVPASNDVISNTAQQASHITVSVIRNILFTLVCIIPLPITILEESWLTTTVTIMSLYGIFMVVIQTLCYNIEPQRLRLQLQMLAILSWVHLLITTVILCTILLILINLDGIIVAGDVSHSFTQLLWLIPLVPSAIIWILIHVQPNSYHLGIPYQRVPHNPVWVIALPILLVVGIFGLILIALHQNCENC